MLDQKVYAAELPRRTRMRSKQSIPTMSVLVGNQPKDAVADSAISMGKMVILIQTVFICSRSSCRNLFTLGYVRLG